MITTFKTYTLSPAFPTKILKDLIKMISFPANCFVLAIDAPLPDGDKTELTKKLVRAVTTSHIKLANYKLQITIKSL